MSAPTYLRCSVPFVEHCNDAHFLVRTAPPRFLARLVDMVNEHEDAIPFADFTGMVVEQWMDPQPTMEDVMRMLPEIEAAVERYVNHGVVVAMRRPLD